MYVAAAVVSTGTDTEAEGPGPEPGRGDLGSGGDRRAGGRVGRRDAQVDGRAPPHHPRHAPRLVLAPETRGALSVSPWVEAGGRGAPYTAVSVTASYT